MQLHILSLSQKGYCSLYYEKIVFCLKRGVLLGLKISDFGWKRGDFFTKIREKGVFFKLGYERGIALVGSVCVLRGKTLMDSAMYVIGWLMMLP